MMFMGVGTFVELAIFAAHRTRLLPFKSVFPRILCAVFVGAVPGTSMVIFIDNVFRDPGMSPGNFPAVYAQVVLLSLLIALTDHYVWRPLVAETAAASDPRSDDPSPAPFRPRLYGKLPDDAQEASILSMSMQDHYVEVMTTNGPHLVLLRFSDAIGLLDGIDGFQIHRSHWIAADHAKALVRDGRKHRIETADGRELPVSQSFLPGIQDQLPMRD